MKHSTFWEVTDRAELRALMAPGVGSGGANSVLTLLAGRGFQRCCSPGLSQSQEALGRCDVPDMVPDTGFLCFVETSIQTNFSMTVKVDGVAEDGTTRFIHNKAHNRTRTLTCTGVSALAWPVLILTLHHLRLAFLGKKIHTADAKENSMTLYPIPS